MKFFARIVLIAHVCFLLSTALRYIEIARSVEVAPDTVGFQPLTATLIIIGYAALPVGIVLLTIWAAFWLMKKDQPVPLRWMIINLLLVTVELGYFF